MKQHHEILPFGQNDIYTRPDVMLSAAKHLFVRFEPTRVTFTKLL